jgi:hypothetical protein
VVSALSFRPPFVGRRRLRRQPTLRDRPARHPWLLARGAGAVSGTRCSRLASFIRVDAPNGVDHRRLRRPLSRALRRRRGPPSLPSQRAPTAWATTCCERTAALMRTGRPTTDRLSSNSLPVGSTATGIALDPTTGGYWVLSSNGAVAGFNAPSYGQTLVPSGGWGQHPAAVAIAAASDGVWATTFFAPMAPSTDTGSNHRVPSLVVCTTAQPRRCSR